MNDNNMFRTTIQEIAHRNGIFECQTCAQEFNQNEYYPMQVCPNRHNMCQQCVNRKTFRKDKNRRYTCNICNQVIVLRNIRKNPFILRIKDFIQSLIQRDQQNRLRYKNYSQKQQEITAKLIKENKKKTTQISQKDKLIKKLQKQKQEKQKQETRKAIDNHNQKKSQESLVKNMKQQYNKTLVQKQNQIKKLTNEIKRSNQLIETYKKGVLNKKNSQQIIQALKQQKLNQIKRLKQSLEAKVLRQNDLQLKLKQIKGQNQQFAKQIKAQQGSIFQSQQACKTLNEKLSQSQSSYKILEENFAQKQKNFKIHLQKIQQELANQRKKSQQAKQIQESKVKQVSQTTTPPQSNNNNSGFFKSIFKWPFKTVEENKIIQKPQQKMENQSNQFNSFFQQQKHEQSSQEYHECGGGMSYDIQMLLNQIHEMKSNIKQEQQMRQSTLRTSLIQFNHSNQYDNDEIDQHQNGNNNENPEIPEQQEEKYEDQSYSQKNPRKKVHIQYDKSYKRQRSDSDDDKEGDNIYPDL